jgi:hypothetical protein
MTKAQSRPTTTGATSGGVQAIARSIIASNHAEFLKAAQGHRFAFTTMKWMFLVVFLTALGAMIAAVRIATNVPETGFEWSQGGVVAALGAASILLFAVLLYMRPLAALERNSVVHAFLTVVVNSYWTRMLYLEDAADIDAHLEEATAYTTDHLGALLDRQILGVSRYMDLVRKAQDEEGEDPTAYGSPL